MAYSGVWRAGAVTPLEYADATKWGTGINPVHALPDSHKPTQTKEPLGSTAWGGAPPEEITGPIQWGYAAEDAQYYQGVTYQYEQEYPVLGTSTGLLRDAVRGGYPPWGETADGIPAGTELLAVSHGTDIQVNTPKTDVPPGYTGGWLNKARGEVADFPLSANDAQVFINTGAVQGQGKKQLENSRASARGTDQSRAAIQSRTAGMRVRTYAKSLGMGGGPGTPDMSLARQDLPYRPWYFRRGAMPPMEDHTYNTIEYRNAIERTLPPDAGQYVTATETSMSGGGNYGYTTEDGGYY